MHCDTFITSLKITSAKLLKKTLILLMLDDLCTTFYAINLQDLIACNLLLMSLL